MKQIPGGVTALRGFRAWGVHCGIESKKTDKKDLALILPDQECAAATVYTMNRVKAAPLYITMEHLEDGTTWGVATNNGNTNACCPMSHEYAEEMARLAARTVGHAPTDFVVASTGIVSQAPNIAAIRVRMPEVTAGLTVGPEGSDAAARAIMITDTAKKELALACSIGGRIVTLGAIARDSGMIHPNIGTMLCFVTTDCAITQEILSKTLREVIPRTFNRVMVDGDTPANDMCAALASGIVGNPLIEWKDDGYTVFLKVLRQLCQELARAIAGDDEGASRLITCAVREARNEGSAERLAKAVAGPPLVKVTMFGTDANWGRVPCIMGCSKAPLRPEYVDISFSPAVGVVAVCRDDMDLNSDKEAVWSTLPQDEVIISVHLHKGEHETTCRDCDLTYRYMKINGDYRTWGAQSTPLSPRR